MYQTLPGPWEFVVVQHGSGFSHVRADEETRKKQLEEYKKKRIAELEAEIQRVKNLF